MTLNESLELSIIEPFNHSACQEIIDGSWMYQLTCLVPVKRVRIRIDPGQIIRNSKIFFRRSLSDEPYFMGKGFLDPNIVKSITNSAWQICLQQIASWITNGHVWQNPAGYQRRENHLSEPLN